MLTGIRLLLALTLSYLSLVVHLSMLCPRGAPQDEEGTLNVCAHPKKGILANFEHKCWPWNREV